MDASATKHSMQPMSAGESLARLSSQVEAANKLQERVGIVDSKDDVNSTVCRAENWPCTKDDIIAIKEERKEGNDNVFAESADQSKDHLPSKDDHSYNLCIYLDTPFHPVEISLSTCLEPTD